MKLLVIENCIIKKYDSVGKINFSEIEGAWLCFIASSTIELILKLKRIW